MKTPNLYRVKHGYFATTAADGNNGSFEIPHYKVTGYIFFVIASEGVGWQHVSVTVGQRNKAPHRCPTWEEMCWVKDQFWSKDEVVIQYHPAEKDYVSNHEYCLHLWKPIDQELPTPPTAFVGIQSKAMRDLQPYDGEAMDVFKIEVENDEIFMDYDPSFPSSSKYRVGIGRTSGEMFSVLLNNSEVKLIKTEINKLNL